MRGDSVSRARGDPHRPDLTRTQRDASGPLQAGHDQGGPRAADAGGAAQTPDDQSLIRRSRPAAQQRGWRPAPGPPRSIQAATGSVSSCTANDPAATGRGRAWTDTTHPSRYG